MTHKLILEVKKFQLSGAKRFGTVEENLQEVDSTPCMIKIFRWGKGCWMGRGVAVKDARSGVVGVVKGFLQNILKQGVGKGKSCS